MEYLEWNKQLFDYFFDGEEKVKVFYFDDILFQLISGSESGKEEFLNEIKKELLKYKSLKKAIQIEFNNSFQIVDGRRLRSQYPKYFALLIFIILTAREGDDDDMRSNNVKGRVEAFIKEILDLNQIKIETHFDYLEEVWKDLETCTNKKFQTLDSKNKQRKYVSRIERHALFNNNHLQRILGLIIDSDITPHDKIDEGFLKELVQKNKETVGSTFLNNIIDDDGLLNEIIVFLIEYVKSNFDDYYENEHALKGKSPTVKLHLSIPFSSLDIDDFDINHIYKFHFRANSKTIKSDGIEIFNHMYLIEHQLKNWSTTNQLPENVDLKRNSVGKSQFSKQRYKLSKIPKFFYLDREIREYIEGEDIYNTEMFFVLCKENDEINASEEYSTGFNDLKLYKFSKLDQLEFETLLENLGVNKEDIGQITVTGQFLSKSNTIIYAELPYSITFLGYNLNETLVAKFENGDHDIELEYNPDNKDYKIPSEFPLNTKFKIHAKRSGVSTHYFFLVKNLVFGQKSSEDLSFTYDFPNNELNYEFRTKFQLPLARDLFIKEENEEFPVAISGDFLGNSLNNLLLVYLDNNQVKAAELYKLILELNPAVDIRVAKALVNSLKRLNYIDFVDYKSDNVKVNPPTLYFMTSYNRLKYFLSGYRDEALIEQLVENCEEIGADIKIHEINKEYPLPQKIEITCDTQRIGVEIAKNTNISINEYEPYNDKCIYQLGKIYVQKSVEEYFQNIDFEEVKLPPVNLDLFNLESLNWNRDVRINEVADDSFPALFKTIMNYNSEQFFYLMSDRERGYESADLSMLLYRLFQIRKMNVLKKVNDTVRTDFLVPIKIPIPDNIEKSLVLLNAEPQSIVKNSGRLWKKYSDVDYRFLKIIEEKLSHQIEII